MHRIGSVNFLTSTGKIYVLPRHGFVGLRFIFFPYYERKAEALLEINVSADSEGLYEFLV